MHADISHVWEQAQVIEPEEIKAEEPQAVTMTLEQRYRNNANNQDSEFTKQMRATLLPGITDAIAALIDVVRTSKNAQARTAAARQILKVAYSTGVIERDPMKDLLKDFADDFGQLDDDPRRED